MRAILILLLIPFQIAHARVSCRNVTMSGCEMKACVGKVSGYPVVVASLIPRKAKSIRIHLHGFSEQLSAKGIPTGPYNPSYDWNNVKYRTIESAILAFEKKAKDSPLKTLEAYQMGASVCQLNEIVVMPTSRGHCDTYKKVFTTPESFGAFVTELGFPSGLPLHLSGHSGAGKIMKNILRYDIPELTLINKVSAFDAFYAPGEAEALISWARRSPERQVKSVVLETGPPQKYAAIAFGRRNSSQLENIKVSKNQGLDHWSLVRAFWIR